MSSAWSSRVYKYPLPPGGWVSIEMPAGARVLCVQVQDGSPFLWARVAVHEDGRTNPGKSYAFRVAGTGRDLGDAAGRYIGTFQLEGGALVFHVFAEKESSNG